MGKVEVVAEAANAEEALILVEQYKPDLIFLDIQMPEKSGFELIEDLIEAPYVIFTTAYEEYALKAFEVGAIDYLLKPIRTDRLKDAVDKVLKFKELEPLDTNKVFNIDDKIFIKDGEKCFFIKVADIKRVVSEGNYAKIFFKEQHVIVHRSLNGLAQKLDPKHFFRANRQEIVNLNYVERVEPFFSNTLVFFLQGNIKIELSRRQSVLFKDLFGI